MTFDEITNVEVEHLLGAATGKGLVKLRVEGRKTTLLDELTPENARSIACHLFECAARAEYEQDFNAAAQKGGMDAATVVQILHLIRFGERARHEGPGA